MTMDELRTLIAGDLGEQVGAFLASTHLRAEWSARKGHFEGTVRAALFAVLRERLPATWLVEAEVPYPDHGSYKNDRADILLWSPDDEPYVIEVKPSDDINAIRNDFRKIAKHIGMKSSVLQYGCVAFLAYRSNLQPFDSLRGPQNQLQVLPVPVR